MPQSAPAKPAAPPSATKPEPATVSTSPALKPALAPVKRVDSSAIRAAEPKPGTGRSSFLRVCLWALNISIVLAVVLVVGNHLKNRPPQGDGEKSVPLPSVPSPAAKQGPSTAQSPPSETAPPATTRVPVPPKVPKLIGDLKVTQVAIDQPKGAKGSRLVYVTGILKNDSDHQRFGVRVEFELLDATTNKVGTATDYRQMLEPRATWQFRAIVTDRRATAARLAGLKEE